MKSLGFSNFRRFVKFGPIEYGDITFLVGRNNSGKSTFVKALMLLVHYLKSDRLDVLDFDKDNLEDLNIVTYDRAKCKSKLVGRNNFIEFDLMYEDFEFHLKVTGNKDQVRATVMDFSIRDIKNGYQLYFNPSLRFINFQSESGRNNFPKEILELLEGQLKEKRSLKKKISDKLSQDYILLNTEIESLRKEIQAIKKNLKDAIHPIKMYLNAHYKRESFSEILDEILIDFEARYGVRYKENQELGGKKFKEEEKQNEFESLRYFYQNKAKIEDFFGSVRNFISRHKIKYLPATLYKQSALFSIRDKNNALAQAIHEYKQLNIPTGSEAERFVHKWMSKDEFEIGETFDLKLIAGESYIFNVISNNITIPLADKGMGSIQAMLLILRLATIIHKKQKDGCSYTLFIEEPELNLHPALQSKLCDLFYEAYIEYNIRFVIETHSEYLIRRSQVYVKLKELQIFPNENPFNVIYFNKDITNGKLVWNMEYRKDGKFFNEFGQGFFDESNNLVYELL